MKIFPYAFCLIHISLSYSISVIFHAIWIPYVFKPIFLPPPYQCFYFSGTKNIYLNPPYTLYAPDYSPLFFPHTFKFLPASNTIEVPIERFSSRCAQTLGRFSLGQIERPCFRRALGSRSFPAMHDTSVD